MTKPKNTRNYPLQFLDILDAIGKDKDKQIVIEFEDDAAAMDFQLEFIGFRRAADREGLAQQYPELNGITAYRRVNVITMAHKDRSRSALAIQKALGKKPEELAVELQVPVKPKPRNPFQAAMGMEEYEMLKTDIFDEDEPK